MQEIISKHEANNTSRSMLWVTKYWWQDLSEVQNSQLDETIHSPLIKPQPLRPTLKPLSSPLQILRLRPKHTSRILSYRDPHRRIRQQRKVPNSCYRFRWVRADRGTIWSTTGDCGANSNGRESGLGIRWMGVSGAHFVYTGGVEASQFDIGNLTFDSLPLTFGKLAKLERVTSP